MAAPRWAHHKNDKRYGHNSTTGNSDTFNRANKDLYALLNAQHNDDDGSHAIGDFLVCEQASYSGNSTDDRVISLTNSDLQIAWIWILARGTQYPVFKSSDMSGDTTKEIATSAFQADQIQDITTKGQFTVGIDATVNASGTDYDYLVWGINA